MCGDGGAHLLSSIDDGDGREAVISFSVVLALASLSLREVGLSLSTMGLNGVISSSKASLIALDLMAGVNSDEKMTTSSYRLLLSLGLLFWSNPHAQILP